MTPLTDDVSEETIDPDFPQMLCEGCGYATPAGYQPEQPEPRLHCSPRRAPTTGWFARRAGPTTSPNTGPDQEHLAPGLSHSHGPFRRRVSPFLGPSHRPMNWRRGGRGRG